MPGYTAAAITEAHAAKHDLAGWLAAVLATVAAGLGSTEALLAGRPGSWEAAHVRALLAGMVGWDDEHLWRLPRCAVTFYACCVHCEHDDMPDYEHR